MTVKDQLNKELKNKDQLAREMREKVQGIVDLDKLIVFTLDNFSYRYLESSSTGEIKTTALGNGAFALKGIETSQDILKTWENDSVRKVLDIKKPESVMLGVFCQVHNQSKGMLIEVNCFLNWNTPNFEMTPGRFLSINKSMEFEDLIDLRNRFANFLEPAFEIFV